MNKGHSAHAFQVRRKFPSFIPTDQAPTELMKENR